MSGRIIEITATTIAAPIYFVTDVFDQGNISSGGGREFEIQDDGTLAGFAEHHDEVWNMTGGSLASGDRVFADDITDKSGNVKIVAIRKL